MPSALLLMYAEATGSVPKMLIPLSQGTEGSRLVLVHSGNRGPLLQSSPRTATLLVQWPAARRPKEACIAASIQLATVRDRIILP
jgi:hypothetical protein